MATTKKTSTKTTTTEKAAGKVVAAEQLTLVDALPVATEPPVGQPRRRKIWARKRCGQRCTRSITTGDADARKLKSGNPTLSIVPTKKDGRSLILFTINCERV